MVRKGRLIFKKRLRQAVFFAILIAFRSLMGDVMAKQCDICGKKPVSGNNISHAHNRTRRRWEPNLQSVRAKVDGRTKRLTVCTQCIKSNKVLKAA
jgi:large subunit ribosomal protein L28